MPCQPGSKEPATRHGFHDATTDQDRIRSWWRRQHEGLLEGASAVVATPGGGLHAYFTGSDQASGRLPRQHLDFRAQGGYVLAPPSQVEGRPYRLIAHHAQSGGLDWAAVTTLLEPERTRPAQPRTVAPGDLSHLAVWVERLQEGNRNAYFCCSERVTDRTL